jgi:plasmid stabilization system protein ParE
MAGRRSPIIWSPDALADLSDIWDYYAALPADTQQTSSFMKSRKRAEYWKIILLPDAAEMRSDQGYVPSLQVRMSFSIA